MNPLFSDVNSPQQVWERQSQNDIREIQKAGAKAMAAEEAKTWGLFCRQKLKEEERERKKAEGEKVEKVEICPTGEIIITSENLAVPAIPRSATNMCSPSLEVLKRASDKKEQIYLLRCFVGESEKAVFLDAQLAGSGTYLQRKFASVGIYIKLKTPKAKQFAVRLLCVLIEGSVGERLLPEQEGWMKKPDGRFEYVQKGGLTWEQAKKMCR